MEKLQITRSSPDYDELVELYKKEKNSKLKERYHALFLIRKEIYKKLWSVLYYQSTF